MNFSVLKESYRSVSAIQIVSDTESLRSVHFNIQISVSFHRKGRSLGNLDSSVMEMILALQNDGHLGILADFDTGSVLNIGEIDIFQCDPAFVIRLYA